MKTPEYKFFLPAVIDFPDEPVKKPRNINKKEEPKISDEEEEYEEANEIDDD